MAAETEDFCSADLAEFPELVEVDAVSQADQQRTRRLVCADVAAIDQMLVYNRFGSHNPFGMIFALTRDLIPASEGPQDCDGDMGMHARREGLVAGNVRLSDCKRPRPLTLRANVGDVLHVRVHNYLRDPVAEGRPDYSQTFCRQKDEPAGTWRARIRALVSEGTVTGTDAQGGAAALVDAGPTADGTDRLVAALCEAGSAGQAAVLATGDDATDWPRTRAISFVIDGLRPLRDPATGEVSKVCLGLGSLPPGQDHVDCYWHAEREGPHFINSTAASSGGEGDGGSLTHGLFGSLAVEPQAADAGPTGWYLSQTTKAGFDAAWPESASPRPHDRSGALDYEATATVDGETLPVLNILKDLGGGRHEIVHNALNAIIRPAGDQPFREFTVVFHDELKTFYTRNFEELGRFTQFEGVRDGFAINYGASGLGAMILANRKGIGPAADCMECLYEEFFLESWANGDPALLEEYADDPSNVHHSYLNDPIVFRNYHAGPKETHVFHLHAHQWFGGNDDARGAYLDSQTVAPRQGFTYRIYHGGLRDLRPGDQPPAKGWWEGLGSGNRNRTVGDSIFHCHLYPHFAQGMWELWRVHDVLEDGSRKLPDGQAEPGLSTELLDRDAEGRLTPIMARQGTVAADGSYVADAAGTPVPAIVPLPDQAAPLLPTYASSDPTAPVAQDEAVPGYPFFIAGKPGHRAPQAPLDIAEGEGGELLSGALPRHRVETGTTRSLGIAVTLTGMAIDAATSDTARRKVEDALYRVTAKMLALGDLTAHFEQARIAPLAQVGEPLEQAAMAFHHNGSIDGRRLALSDVQGNPASYDPATGGYLSPAANGAPDALLPFAVNGAPPKPGAPFADPCGAPDAFAGRLPFDPSVAGRAAAAMAMRPDPFAPGLADFVPDPKVTGFRRYAASAVQADIVTNKAGWHDPQGRLNVLTADSDRYKTLGPTAREEPFFFRAYSGECIEFRHTNELPKDLELDDFQVKTPTDTIGQHIHLVKFDVTSADGSGNGWNYEDGTFAADELAGRLCAWAATGDAEAVARVDDLTARVRAVLTPEEAADFSEPASFCDWSAMTGHKLWSLERSRFPFLFQTTVQRWFADPILSIETGGPDGKKADRTMRTVFTHDHFGPSSIQQHGFYSALVIEPAGKAVCPGVTSGDQTCMETANMPGELVNGGPAGVGVHKIVTGGEDPELHPDYREFALAIADFALLYDPTDSNPDDLVAAAGPLPGGTELAGPLADRASPKGLATLVCEAQHRDSAFAAASDSALELLCGSHVTRKLVNGALTPVEDVETPPAMVARELIDPTDITGLRRHFAFVRYRAGHGEGFARPVNAPARPESISVDHHDPYLVNYRGEPVPLRIGETGAKQPEAEAPETPEGEPQQDAALVPTKAAVILAQAEGAAEEQAPPSPGKSAFDCYAERDGDVLAQFGRRAPAAPVAAADGIVAPGIEADHDVALEQAMADVAGALDCSIDSQSPDPRGNLGHVFRSELQDEELQPAGARAAETGPARLDVAGLAEARDLLRNRPHGDPATPLLETYSDERVQIRLIQGAQEVQHTFNLEGMQWRRQIDQKYPSNSVPLDSDRAGLTWWQACHEAGRSGNARQHDRWREGMLKASDDLPFWADHSRMVAHCDNLEGFVAAQEVGISEHFEIPAAPSKYASGYREIVAGVPSGDGPADEKSGSFDYLFHFGSQDAIWNGAWGLMRVFQDGQVRDETRRLENLGIDPVCDDEDSVNPVACKVNEALKPLAGETPENAGRSLRDAQISVQGALECPAGAPLVEAYAIAMPLPGGQQYASWEDRFRDPSALALIHVPGELVTPWIGTGVPEDRIASLQQQAMDYFDDEPMVIRANAGDCLRLSILNLLRSNDADLQSCPRGKVDDKGALSDCLGDAPMPKIVALNVEPHWVPAAGADEHGAGAFQQDDEIDVRPSARLAMVAPLSMLTRGGEAHLPFGVNQTTTSPLGSVQVSDYYLGLLRVDWQLIVGLMRNRPLPLADGASPGTAHEPSNAVQQCTTRGLVLQGAPDSLPADTAAAQLILRGEDPDYYVSTRAPDPEIDPETLAENAGWFPIKVLGQSYLGFVQENPFGPQRGRPLSAGVLDNVARMTVDCVAQLLETKGLGATAELSSSFPQPEAAPISAIPYAFGTVPLKPAGDYFNQLTHGLFGALVVEPQGATYPGRPAGLDGPAPRGEYRPEPVGIRARAHHGRGHNTLVSFADGGGGQRKLREFVLFYQDGLNLWDDRSASRWTPIIPAPPGNPVRIVRDCPVCDDSYDLGEKAASYIAPAYHRRLRQAQGGVLEASSDLNGRVFDPDFFAQKDGLSSNSLRLWALPGEEVIVRVIHPGGRARQRAFVTVGNDYDDLFPGFGFPHAGLLAPGKSINAALSAPVRSGCYVWSDGPRLMDAAGAWGLLDVLTGEGQSSCGFLD